MTDQKYTLADLKDRAKTLRISNPELTHSASLEVLAKSMGFRDWNTLHATTSPAPVWANGDRVSGTYLGHRFAGLILNVEPQGAVHQMTLKFDHPVDVVQSDAFSNMRARVTVVVNAKGRTLEKTADGQPHLILD